MLLHCRVAPVLRPQRLDIVGIVQEADVEAPGRPRAASRCGRRTTSPRSTAGPGRPANRPVSSRRRSGSDRSRGVDHQVGRGLERRHQLALGRQRVDRRPAGRPADARRRVSVNRRRSTSSSHSRNSRQAAPPARASARTADAAAQARSRACGCRCRLPGGPARHRRRAATRPKQVDRQVVHGLVAAGPRGSSGRSSGPPPTCRSRPRPRPCAFNPPAARRRAIRICAGTTGVRRSTTRMTGSSTSADLGHGAFRQPLMPLNRQSARHKGSPAPRPWWRVRKMPLPRSSIKPVAPAADAAKPCRRDVPAGPGRRRRDRRRRPEAGAAERTCRCPARPAAECPGRTRRPPSRDSAGLAGRVAGGRRALTRPPRHAPVQQLLDRLAASGSRAQACADLGIAQDPGDPRQRLELSRARRPRAPAAGTRDRPARHRARRSRPARASRAKIADQLRPVPARARAGWRCPRRCRWSPASRAARGRAGWSTARPGRWPLRIVARSWNSCRLLAAAQARAAAARD